MFNKVVSFIIVSVCSICVNFSANASLASGHPVLESEEPRVIYSQPGLFSINLSKGIADAVRSGLADAFPSDAAVPGVFQIDSFNFAVSNSHYPAPESLNINKLSLQAFRTFLFGFRQTNGLPMFSTVSYNSIDDCCAAFMTFVEENLSDAAALTEALEKIEEEKASIDLRMLETVDRYRSFYAALPIPFSPLRGVQYVLGLLNFEGGTPITEESAKQITVLQESGFLELLSPLEESDGGPVFRASSGVQVEAYAATNGAPQHIVLGCSHSNQHEFLESLGLPSDVWCGACEHVPHEGAMVVSLHEPSADILGNLNDASLWAAISENSVDDVKDETWALSAFLPETFSSILRVLKPGGEFTSIHYAVGAEIKDALLSIGFDAVDVEEQSTSGEFKLIARKKADAE